jgi:trk system potassium uptake protein TrkH
LDIYESKVKDTPGFKNVNLFRRMKPAQILVLGFALVILLGSVLLSLPVASASRQPTHFLDAFFTATSAVCVTGLVVQDTGTHFSTFGQVVILALIQIGGLGFMTMATFFALLLGKRINLKERLLMQEALNQLTVEGIVKLVRHVLVITFLIEGTGALILGIRWSGELGLARGFYYGLFHSISAFNNAGFDLFGEFRSLTGFVSDITVNTVITILIILGGIGFTVIVDLINKRRWRGFSLHTKIALSTTAALLAIGAISVFVLEYNNSKTLAPLSLPAKILASWFQSVTPRTAGYNTLDIAGLRDATQLLIIILMFIGASPGSTGGGIKTTTFRSLITAVSSMVRGRQDVELYERRLPQDLVYRSLTITIIATALVLAVTMLLTITETADFLMILFETVSAFGTVGLTMGLTTKLTVIGKILIALTMFAGRVGPLTIAFAVAQKQQKTLYRLAEEKIMIG